MGRCIAHFYLTLQCCEGRGSGLPAQFFPHVLRALPVFRTSPVLKNKKMSIAELYEIYCTYPSITTDTRAITPCSLFFALRGANFDGNAFALKALEAGCARAIVDDPTLPDDPRLIRVDDVLTTLQDLAAYHRRHLHMPVIQITGTNGKTTTKELVAAVLSRKGRVTATRGNLNNHIGVPRTLLTVRPDDAFAVIETGANHPGEIAFLCRMVQADCGLITNVGMAHLEGFGSFEGVKRTKGELYDDLRRRPGTFVFLHADDADLSAMAQGLPAVTYGATGQGFDVEGEVTACSPFLCLRWHYRQGPWHEASTRLIGSYNLPNALAALAVGLHYGVDEAEANAALEAYVPTNNRSELKRTATNTLIVDAYNANLTSMRAALDNFRQINHSHKVAILGEMRELGDASSQAHAEVALRALQCGCSEVWLVGPCFAPYAAGCRYFADVEAVRAHLAAHPLSHSLVLIKGSNGTRLYTLPDML